MASDKRAATRQRTRAAAKRETAAQRKAREAKAAKEAADAKDAESAVAEAVEVADAPPAGEGNLNAVVLHRGFNEQGVPIVAIQTSGDVRISEVEHIVKQAAKQIKEEFGFD